MIAVPEDGWGAEALDMPGTLLGGARPSEPSFGVPDWLGSNDERIGDPLDDADSARQRAGAVFRRQRSIGAFNRELDTVLASIAEAPDWSDGLERFDRTVGELRQRHTGDLSSSEDREAFARHAGEFAAMQRIGLKRALVERQASDALSQLDDQLAYYAGKAVDAEHDAFRQLALDSGIRAIDELREAGYLTPEAAEARRQAFLGRIDDTGAERPTPERATDDIAAALAPLAEKDSGLQELIEHAQDNPDDPAALLQLASSVVDLHATLPGAIRAPQIPEPIQAVIRELLRRGTDLLKRRRRDTEGERPPPAAPTPVSPPRAKPPVVPPLEDIGDSPAESGKLRWKRLAPVEERYTTSGPGGLARFEDGSTEFGRLDEDAAKVARSHGIASADEGAIVLQRGFQDPDDVANGMGADHIRSNHEKNIRAYKDESGRQIYRDAEELVADVAANYNRIARGEKGRIILGIVNGKEKIVVIEIARKGPGYTVITAGIRNKGWLERPQRALPWRRTDPSLSPASGLPASNKGIATDDRRDPYNPEGQGG